MPVVLFRELSNRGTFGEIHKLDWNVIDEFDQFLSKDGLSASAFTSSFRVPELSEFLYYMPRSDVYFRVDFFKKGEHLNFAATQTKHAHVYEEDTEFTFPDIREFDSINITDFFEKPRWYRAERMLNSNAFWSLLDGIASIQYEIMNSRRYDDIDSIYKFMDWQMSVIIDSRNNAQTLKFDTFFNVSVGSIGNRPKTCAFYVWNQRLDFIWKSLDMKQAKSYDMKSLSTFGEINLRKLDRDIASFCTGERQLFTNKYPENQLLDKHLKQQLESPLDGYEPGPLKRWHKRPVLKKQQSRIRRSSLLRHSQSSVSSSSSQFTKSNVSQSSLSSSSQAAGGEPTFVQADFH